VTATTARLALVLASVGLVGVAAACGDDDGADDDDGDVTLSDEASITYEFGDASVPPEFHRSYTLTIDATEVRAVVDSYGDVIEDVTAPLPADVWAGLAADGGTVADLDVEDDGGCDGGTSRSLEITDRGETLADSSFSVCGGANEAPAEVVDAYVQPVLDAIPDWEALVAT